MAQVDFEWFDLLGELRDTQAAMSMTSTATVARTKAPDEGMASHLSDSFAAPVLPSPGARKPAHIQKME